MRLAPRRASTSGFLCLSKDGQRNRRGCKPGFRAILMLILTAPLMAWGQTPAHAAPRHSTVLSLTKRPDPMPAQEAYNIARVRIAGAKPSAPLSILSEEEAAKRDLDSCEIDEVERLPGSQAFGSHFMEAMAGDPNPRASDASVVWGLTADLSSEVAPRERALYISKSIDGGKTWERVARLDSRYFNADIGEGERNGIAVSPGGTDFVVTTQRGAFQVFAQSRRHGAVVKSIVGPRVSGPDPKISIPKRAGDPVKAGVVKITPDGKHMIVGYGYFDLNPQLFTYHRAGDGSWVEDGPLPRIPTRMDILSMEFGDPKQDHPDSLYVGTGDQAYRLDLHTMQWTRIEGVGPDSAIQGISMVHGPHLAACWGVYNPVTADAVERLIHAHFLLHREMDEAGPNIRAFGIEVDPLRPDREVVTSITGVYVSGNNGRTWRRLNQLPDGEYRSAHFNADGTVIVSGIPGTFLVNPFSKACAPHFATRGR